MEKKIDLVISAFLIYNNKLLLVHHKKLDKWLAPGGHIESNETPDQAVRREVKEETGLDLKFFYMTAPLETSDEIEQMALPFYANIHSVGDHNHACLFYLCEPTHGNVKISDESKDHKWVTKKELLGSEDIPDGVKKIGEMAFNIYNKAKKQK